MSKLGQAHEAVLQQQLATSQWLYILLHSLQVSSSFVAVCGRTLQKAFSKSVKAGGLDDVGRPCMAPAGEDAEESACWLS